MLGVAHPSPPVIVAVDVENVAPEMSSTDVIVAEELPVYSHEPYMTIAIFVRKRENSCTIARSSK